MAKNLQDEILAFEDCKEYDISYPVIVTRWEIKQVHGLNKQYLQVYFQKLEKTVKAFQMNIACYSAFGKEVEKLSDISIQEVDKKSIEFFKVIPLNTDTRKVEIFMRQCLLADGTIIKKSERQMVVNTFKPFAEEDKEAGKRLLSSAVGYPIDNVSHWYCACGTAYSSEQENCIKCGKSKKEIFLLIAPDKVEEEKGQKIDERKKQKIKRIVIGTFVLALGLITFLTLFFPILFVREESIFIYAFNIGDDRLYTQWGLFIYYYIGQLLFSICDMVIGTLIIVSFNEKIIKFSDTKAKKLSIGFAISCLVLLLVYLLIGYWIYQCNDYFYVGSGFYDKPHKSFYGETHYDYKTISVFWLGFVLGSIIFIGFMIYLKFHNRIYDYFTKEKIQKNKEKIQNGLNEQSKQRKKRNKLFSIIGGVAAAVCILIGALVGTLTPFEEIKVNGIIFKMEEDGYVLTDYKGSNTVVDIPSKVRGVPITVIGDKAFSGETPDDSVMLNLTNVTIPDSVKEIGTWAFAGCSSLENISIPNSVVTIGEGAFAGCSGLTIYCKVNSKPSGWSSYWNTTNCPVVWGYKG